VLVAFAIAGLALAVLYQAALGGVTAADTAGRYQEALSRAQSRLAALEQQRPLIAADRQGADGSLWHWHERVVELAAPVGPAALALYGLRVDVSWRRFGQTRAVSLETERVASATGAP
jgi:general secretion pathway protein I